MIGIRRTNWEDETPPPHVKWEFVGLKNQSNSNDKPDEGESPHDKGNDKAGHIKDIACIGKERKGLDYGEQMFGDCAQLY